MAEQAKRDQNHVTSTLFVGSDGGTYNLQGNEATGRIYTTTAGGAGTVTSVSVVTANGFAGTVATATSTPAITISTTVTGILSGNGTAVSAASTTGSGAVVLATSPTLVTPAIGTPSSGTLTNCTGLPIDGGTTGTLPATRGGTGQSTFTKGDILVATDASTLTKLAVGTNTYVLAANSAVAAGVEWVAPSPINTITVGSTTVGSGTTTRVLYNNAGTLGEYVVSGSGNVAMTTSPSFTTPALGTPSAGVLTSCTGLPVATGISGLGTGVATALAINVGSAGAFVTFNGALGTPSSGTVTNLTGTASININGTVGATTPTTGVFTTLVAGSTTSLLLGTAGSAVGNIGFRNATSGTITLAPVTGALGTVTLSLPARTDTLVTLAGTEALTNKTLTSPTITTASLSGAQLLAEGASIALDPSLSADGTWSGITMTGTSGYAQAFGDLVYLDPTDSRWEAVDANAASGADGDARGMLAMVVVAGTDGNSCTLLLQGVIRADANFPTFTVNNPIYVSETAGDVTQTQPTTTDVVIRILGAALTADSMYFAPDKTWITHT